MPGKRGEGVAHMQPTQATQSKAQKRADPSENKPQSWAWSQFTMRERAGEPAATDEEDDSQPRKRPGGDQLYDCNHCGKAMTGNVSRMQQHLLNLNACPGFLKSAEAREVARRIDTQSSRTMQLGAMMMMMFEGLNCGERQILDL